jgi:hypothetical protein
VNIIRRKNLLYTQGHWNINKTYWYDGKLPNQQTALARETTAKAMDITSRYACRIPNENGVDIIDQLALAANIRHLPSSNTNKRTGNAKGKAAGDDDNDGGDYEGHCDWLGHVPFDNRDCCSKAPSTADIDIAKGKAAVLFCRAKDANQEVLIIPDPYVKDGSVTIKLVSHSIALHTATSGNKYNNQHTTDRNTSIG